MRNVGQFLITHELLVQVLCLPEGTRIIGAEFVSSRESRIVIEHPDLPPVYFGETPTELLPVFRHQEPTVLEDWGIIERVKE